MNKEKKITKKEQNEKLTNKYMIQLSWGVVGMLALHFISNGYQNASTILMMQPLVWTLTGIFAALGVILAVIGKGKKSERICNYAVFSGICALVSLWLACYNKVRPLLESVIRTLTGNSAFMLSSFWNVRIPTIAIAVYLVVALICLAIKVNKK